MNKYTVKFNGLCPNDTSIVDHYECDIFSVSTIMVEDILEAVTFFENVAIYQEDVTKKIYESFSCEKVIIRGHHLGVHIESMYNG